MKLHPFKGALSTIHVCANSIGFYSDIYWHGT